jgi:hypothetical protein
VFRVLFEVKGCAGDVVTAGRGNKTIAEYKSDIQIARAAHKKPIMEIGQRLGIPPEDLVPYGHDKAKVSADFIARQKDKPNGNQPDAGG